MITPEQIRAARALLNWKQTDLARESGLSLPSINNIEGNIGSPRVDTMRSVQAAFEAAGIEFIGSDGVRRHSEQFAIREYQGEDFIEKWNDDLQSCMHGPEDVLMMHGIDDRKFAEYAPNQVLRYFEYQQKTQFTEMGLMAEGENYMLSPPTAYRWIAADLLGTIPYFVYKDRFVLIMWEQRRVMIVQSVSIAATFRKQFEFLWGLSKPVPPASRNLLDDADYREKIKKAKPKKK